MGTANLRIDCSRLTASALDSLMSKLCLFVSPILVGGDLIYVNERIHHDNYTSVWKILGHYDVTVD